jgi:hypothetical protein
MTSRVDRAEVFRIVLGSITMDRIERVVSSFYVIFVTCLAAGLSDNAAKFCLAFNVSSSISHALYRLVRPAVPNNQPLVGFFTRAVCTSVGVLCAFRLEKSLLVWANCLLGAELVIGSIESLFHRPNRDDIARTDKYRLRTSIVWTVAGLGLVSQLMPGSEMTFWMRGVLFGPRMLEYGLQTLSMGIRGGQNIVFFG